MIQHQHSNLTPKSGGSQRWPGTPSNNIGVQNFADRYDVLHAGVDTLTLSGVCDDVEAFRALLYCVEDHVARDGYGEMQWNGSPMVLTRAYGVLPYRLVGENGAAVLLPPAASAERGFQLRLGPTWLLERGEGEYEAAAQAEAWRILGLGDMPTLRHISRVDLCMDVLMSVEEWSRINSLVANHIEGRHVITRAKYLRAYTDPGSGVATGFSVGKQDIRLNLYDKKREATKAGGYDWPMWSKVYGRAIPDGCVVARFEYQMQRAFLRSFEGRDAATGQVVEGINTLAELRKGVGTLFDYLTVKWFRLAELEEDHEHKRADLPVWSKLREAFGRAFSVRWLGFRRVNLRRLVSTDLEGLQRQILGCAKSVAAVLGWRAGADGPVSLRMALYAAAEALERADADKWQEGAQRRFQGLRFQYSALGVA